MAYGDQPVFFTTQWCGSVMAAGHNQTHHAATRNAHATPRTCKYVGSPTTTITIGKGFLNIVENEQRKTMQLAGMGRCLEMVKW